MVTQLGIEPMTTGCLVVALITKLLSRSDPGGGCAAERRRPPRARGGNSRVFYSDVHFPVFRLAGTESERNQRDMALKERNLNQEEARLSSNKWERRNKERRKVLLVSSKSR